VTLDWSTLLLQTVNFTLLAWLLQRFLYRPVLRLVDARRAAVEREQAEAAAAADAAKDARAQIAAERAAAEAEREQALKAAAAEAGRLAAARKAEAERAAAAVLEAARKTLAAERAEALAASRRAALDLGVEIAQRVMAELPDAVRAEAWLARIEQRIAGLGEAERAALGAAPGGGTEPAAVRIVTAAPLDAATQAAWCTRLGHALGAGASSGLAADFAADPQLISGAELHFPTAVLRCSWAGTLAGLRAEIASDGEPR
jgi:F-type H+-transporting ATPase subunit b